ncbi:hypothetical protein [Sphingomonas bacterium]|uniref:hypothetical protein n=1 Tax=Sphingomonas bacterium TaxID=1895847 RepID=UPI0015750489|nr:hypothetical protein [Sphingomonas bacterium]
MLKPFADAHRGAFAFMLACPLLFLVPVAAEAVQHLAEAAIGFYDGAIQAKAVQFSPVRMGFGTIKVIALLLPGYWAMRWFAWGDAARAGRPERQALRRFLPLWLFRIAMALPGIWGPVVLGAEHLRIAAWAIGALLLLSFPLDILLARWYASAPLGVRCGPIRSIRAIAPVLLWAIGFNLLTILPAMTVHYALGFAAMKGPDGAKAMLLGIDSCFVGFLAVLIVAVTYEIDRHARGRASTGDVPVDGG